MKIISRKSLLKHLWSCSYYIFIDIKQIKLLHFINQVILSLDPSLVDAKLRSGGEDITRPLSSGKQEFDTDTSRPPLYQPFPKLDALLQCSGC